ncbi:DUF5946 family protein [Blastococcus sp. SYSU D01042]
MPLPPPSDEPASSATEACPGCGAVLAPGPDDAATHPGASPSCARLFEVTLRGLREEAATEAGAAATMRLAEAAYDVQHAGADEPQPGALDRLAAELGAPAPVRRARPARGWTTTIADVAADLDVIDLDVLVGSWARAVLDDSTSR